MTDQFPTMTDCRNAAFAKGSQMPTDREWAEFILANVEDFKLTKQIALEAVGREGDTPELREDRLTRCIMGFKLRIKDFEVIEKDLARFSTEQLAYYRQELKTYLGEGVPKNCLHSSTIFFIQLHQWSMRWCRP